MKSKKGQILIIVLMVMAMGLIVISPLLHYVDTSYNIYLINLKDTNAYYATDAMMEKILNDIYSGVDVYYKNINASTNYSTTNFLSSGYDIDVIISDTVAVPLPPTESDQDWVVLDPGLSICPTEPCLGSMAAGATYDYDIYLLGNTTIEANWTFFDPVGSCCTCWINWGLHPPYYTQGTLSLISYNGSTLKSVFGVNVSAPVQLNFKYIVPVTQSDWYKVRFKNGSWRPTGFANAFFCTGETGNESRPVTSELFSGANQSNYTWVKIGKEVAGKVYLFQDYKITATARENNQKIVSITAYVRHSPGPLAWWKPQTVEIPSWQVQYY